MAAATTRWAFTRLIGKRAMKSHRSQTPRLVGNRLGTVACLGQSRADRQSLADDLLRTLPPLHLLVDDGFHARDERTLLSGRDLRLSSRCDQTQT